MSMDEGSVQKLAIVGGGTAGWITAAAFARPRGRRITIELVESEAIGTVGVGYLHTFGETGMNLGNVGNTAKTGLAYAYHFDASRYALYLREYAEKRGVTRTEGSVEAVERDSSSGDITAITLASGKRVAGDFFIGCTGFRALLLGQGLGVGYDDWSRWLPCDRALAVPSEQLPTLVPFTRAAAKSASRQWRIPLQHRTGNGQVYSSAFIGDDAAAHTLLAGLDTKALGDPRPIRLVTGRRQALWSHNCAGLGLASGFLEPLESTSIHMIESRVSRLVQLFPRGGNADAERAEHSRRCTAEFEQIRDFLILHYHQTARDDSEFWRFCKNVAVPDSLTHKLDLLASSGRVGRDAVDLFREASWVQVMLGQRIIPNEYDPMADQFAPAQLDEFLGNLRTIILRSIVGLPTHEDYLHHHCAAEPPVVPD